MTGPAQRRADPPGGRRNWRALGRLLALVLALAVIVAVPFGIWGYGIEALSSITGALDWMGATGWGWAAGTGLIVSDLLLPVPTAAVMAALGALYGPVLGGLASAFASILAGTLGYWICRGLGPAAAEWLAGRDGIAEAQRLLERWGFGLIVISRWLPVLGETVAFLAGLAAMPFRRFLAALTAGALPVGFVFATAGHLGQETPIVAIVFSALLPIAIWLLARRYLRHGGK